MSKSLGLFLHGIDLHKTVAIREEWYYREMFVDPTPEGRLWRMEDHDILVDYAILFFTKERAYVTDKYEQAQLMWRLNATPSLKCERCEANLLPSWQATLYQWDLGMWMFSCLPCGLSMGFRFQMIPK